MAPKHVSTLELIRLVRDNPVLYDTKHPLYTKKLHKNRKWKQIGEALSISWTLAKTKFKNLYDCYVRHLNSIIKPTGKPAWSWAKYMDFLKEHVVVARDQHVLNDPVDLKTFGKNIPAKVECLGVNTPEDPKDDESDNKITNHNHETINLTKESEKLYPLSPNEAFDATQDVFKGYAKTISQFTLRRQADVKFKIARIIMEAEVAHADERLCRSD